MTAAQVQRRSRAVVHFHREVETWKVTDKRSASWRSSSASSWRRRCPPCRDVHGPPLRSRACPLSTRCRGQMNGRLHLPWLRGASTSPKQTTAPAKQQQQQQQQQHDTKQPRRQSR